MMFKEFESLEAAMTAFLDMGRLKLPGERYFGAESGPKSSEVTVVSEGPGLAVTLKLGAQSRNLNVEFPLEVPRKTEDFQVKATGVFLDADFYVPSEVRISQLGVPEWIEQVLHVFRRDAPKFLNQE